MTLVYPGNADWWNLSPPARSTSHPFPSLIRSSGGPTQIALIIDDKLRDALNPPDGRRCRPLIVARRAYLNQQRRAKDDLENSENLIQSPAKESWRRRPNRFHRA